MSEVKLAATINPERGTRSSRRLRRDGRVPGVVYGLDQDPQSIAVDWPDLRAALTTDAGLNAIIELSVEGQTQLSIVKDLQRHPVRRDVLHVDFIRVDADATVEVEVPIILTGEAKKVTQQSGMVDQTIHLLPVNAKITSIPDQLEVAIDELDIGQTVRIDDIDFPAGVEPVGDPEEAIASAVITRSTMEAMRLEEEAEAAAEEGEEGAEGDAEDDDSSSDGGDDD